MTDGRFAAAGRTDQRDFLSCLDVERYAVEDFLFFVVGKLDVFKRDIAADIFNRTRSGGIFFGNLVDDFQKALESGHAVLILLHKADQRLHRMNEQIDGNDERGIIRKVDLAVVQENTARNKNDDIEHFGDK